MALFFTPPSLSIASPWSDRGPRIVVGGRLRWLCLWGFVVCSHCCDSSDVRLHFVELVLDAADEVSDVWIWDCRIDGVPAHATLVISVYPRGAAASRLLGFRLAPSTPSGAKVLRAELAVIARRAYGLIVHVDGVHKCLRCCPGSVPPGWHLCLTRSHPRRTVPRAVSAVWAWILCLADAFTLLPIVATGLQMGADVVRCWGRG